MYTTYDHGHNGPYIRQASIWQTHGFWQYLYHIELYFTWIVFLIIKVSIYKTHFICHQHHNFDRKWSNTSKNNIKKHTCIEPFYILVIMCTKYVPKSILFYSHNPINMYFDNTYVIFESYRLNRHLERIY